MKRLWSAFLSTVAGLRWAVRHEAAIRQELAVLVLALPVSFVVARAGWVRIALVGAVLLVLMIELLNTAIEKLCDHLAPAPSPAIKVVKDLGSAAVFTAIVLGVLVWLFAVAALLR